MLKKKKKAPKRRYVARKERSERTRGEKIRSFLIGAAMVATVFALCNAEIASLVDFLGGFEDAEQLSEREYVLDLYEAEPPLSMDLTIEKDGVNIEGAAELKFDETLDGWYAAERIEDAEAIARALREAGAIRA